ncbi:MAG: phytoene/squalene synthase family protein [Armatimonadota bacterium]
MLIQQRLATSAGALDYPERNDDLALCRAITHRHARSFSAGIRCFPARVRAYTYGLYGFVRLPDDIVDERGLSDADAHRELSAWIDRWHTCLADGGRSDEPVFRAMSWVMRCCHVPRSCTDDFFAAMLADTSTKSYRTYDDLRGYMHGSASIVGEMMCHLVGCGDPDAIPYARRLGDAFQMTNFLRDVSPDWHDRGRLYLPLDELSAFGVEVEDIARGRVTPAWKDLMRFEIERTRALYAAARPGIALLPPDCRFGVALAADIYGAILDRIEDADYDVFSARVSTSSWRKASILGRRLMTR